MKLLDLSLYNRQPLGKVYDLIIQRGVEKKTAKMPDEDLNLTTSSTKAQVTAQAIVPLSVDQSVTE